MVGEKIYLKRKLAGIADHLWDSLAVLTYPKITVHFGGHLFSITGFAMGKRASQ